MFLLLTTLCAFTLRCCLSLLTGLSKSHYLEAIILNLLRATNATAPTTLYLAAFTVMPNDAGSGGTEVTTVATAYVREVITFGAPATESPSGSIVTNSADVIYPVATANYGTVVGVGIYDAITAGNLLYYGVLDANEVINTNDQLKIAAGALSVEED